MGLKLFQAEDETPKLVKITKTCPNCSSEKHLAVIEELRVQEVDVYSMYFTDDQSPVDRMLPRGDKLEFEMSSTGIGIMCRKCNWAHMGPNWYVWLIEQVNQEKEKVRKSKPPDIYGTSKSPDEKRDSDFSSEEMGTFAQ